MHVRISLIPCQASNVPCEVHRNAIFGQGPSFRFQSQQWRESQCLCKRGASPPRKLVLWPHVLNRGRAIQALTFPNPPVSFFFFFSFLFIPFLSIHLPRFSFGCINWPSRGFWFASSSSVCPSCCSSRPSSLFWPCRSLAQLLKRCVRFDISVDPRDFDFSRREREKIKRIKRREKYCQS